MLAAVFLLLLTGAASAQNLTSTTYNLDTVMDVSGNKTLSANYIVYTSMGQVSGITTSPSYSMCAGFLCHFIEYIISAKITFLLELNISGSENDTAFVDNFTQYKQYKSADLINYYTCIQDVNISGAPTFGIIFAGSSLNYINLSAGNSFVLRVSQGIPGNELILPITKSNCTIFNTRISQITQFGTVMQPFVLLDEIINAIELVLSYPNIDIAGSFDRTGSFSISIEKNETDEGQIIIRPV